jgi:hypothetical protein
MGTEVATASAESPALGHRELISLARNPSRWTHSAALAVAGVHPVDGLTLAIARCRSELAPVPDDKLQLDNWRAAVGERLKGIGAKIAPHLSVAQGDAWRAAMTDALADLPALVVLTAVKRAIHRPMQFVSEAEGVIRQIAGEVTSERQEAIARMERLKSEIERAAAPLPALPAPVEQPDLTSDEIRRLCRGDIGGPVLKMGLAAGWITQEQIDAALAVETEQTDIDQAEAA